MSEHVSSSQAEDRIEIITSEPLTPGSSWDGTDLCAAFALATSLLNLQRDHVNALNVFPVPDGDTGTNMALTMNTAMDAVPEPPTPIGEAAALIARGALMGARGNSGVILSQFFRGFSKSLQGQHLADGPALAHALESARDMAYKAVVKPVEGTMLTVMRGAAEAADRAARKRDHSLDSILTEAVNGAQKALDSTPELLEILRQAQVVDAGGQGIVYILQGLSMYARGESLDSVTPETSGTVGANMAFLDQVDDLHGEDAFGYCTNFMVIGEGFDFERARKDLSTMGQSAVIVGDETLLKVHIHTLEPDKVLGYALALGSLDQIKIDNMTLQTETLTTQRQQATGTAPEQPEHIPGDLAVIAVAAGSGIAEALRTMGVTHLVHGGQTMNPSTQELLKVVEAQSAPNVIILPNNPNILLAANQVTSLSNKQVEVVPTRSVPQALAALSVFNHARSLTVNAQEMRNALDMVTTVEITTAVRDVELNGVTVKQGQLIGLVNDQLTTAADSMSNVSQQVFIAVDQPDAELVSIFSGQDAREADIDALRHAATAAFPDAEIEIHIGGQPHYLFVIGIE